MSDDPLDAVVASWKPQRINREEALAHIYGEVASGRPLYRVLRDDRQDNGLPSYAEFWRWHMADADVRDNLARARENGAEVWMDKAVDTAENQELGVKTTHTTGGEDGDKTQVVEEDMLGHRKLKIETYMKAAAMIKPRKYGPRVDLNHRGTVATASVTLPEDPNEAARVYREMMQGLSENE